MSNGTDIRLEYDGEVPEGEPFYVRQYGDIRNLNRDDLHAWLDQCRDEAKVEGAKSIRFSVDDPLAPTMAIVEAWKEKRVKDQGAIRWQLTAKDTTP